MLRARRENVKRAAIFGGGEVGALDVVAVSLVDRDHVGEFDEALLDALQLVACARQHQREKEIGHVADRRFRLADADGFHQHDIEACGLAQQHRLAGLGSDTAERAGRRRGADEGVVFSREPRHPRLVAEDRAAGARRRGIDGQHRDLVPLGDQSHAERIDGGGLADTRRARDADANSLAGERQQFLNQIARLRLMIGAAAFDQGDGAGQRRAVARAEGVGDFRHRVT